MQKLFDQAQLARSDGRYQEALKLYQRIIDLDPAGSAAHQAYFLMGETYYFGLKDIPLALRIYEDLGRRGKASEESFDAQIRVAEIYQGKRNFRQAIVEYQRLLQDYPQAKQAASFQCAIGDAYFALNEFNQARVEYEALLSKYPKSSEWSERAAFQIAETFFMESACREAITAYENFRKNFKNSSFEMRARFGIANCEEDLGHYEKAMGLYNDLTSTYPNREVVELKKKNLRERMEKRLPPPQEKLLNAAPQEH